MQVQTQLIVSYDRDSLSWSVGVPPDGNCLFWSVALAYLITSYSASPTRDNLVATLRKLMGGIAGSNSNFVNLLEINIQNFLKTLYPGFIYNKFTQKLIKRLRSKVVDFMRQHKDDFSDFIEYDFDNYLKEMLLSGTWGGEQEINALCNLLGCNISVYDKTNNRTNSYDPTITAFNGEDRVTLYLSFENRNHYFFSFLETNFQRECRESFSILPFADGFPDNFFSKTKRVDSVDLSSFFTKIAAKNDVINGEISQLCSRKVSF